MTSSAARPVATTVKKPASTIAESRIVRCAVLRWVGSARNAQPTDPKNGAPHASGQPKPPQSESPKVPQASRPTPYSSHAAITRRPAVRSCADGSRRTRGRYHAGAARSVVALETMIDRRATQIARSAEAALRGSHGHGCPTGRRCTPTIALGAIAARRFAKIGSSMDQWPVCERRLRVRPPSCPARPSVIYPAVSPIRCAHQCASVSEPCLPPCPVVATPSLTSPATNSSPPPTASASRSPSAVIPTRSSPCLPARGPLGPA